MWKAFAGHAVVITVELRRSAVEGILRILLIPEVAAASVLVGRIVGSTTSAGRQDNGCRKQRADECARTTHAFSL
jgi:hypothetical protein